MRRPRTLIAAALALVVVITLVVVVAAGGGGGDGETTTSPTPTEAPSGDAAPPIPGGLPPGIAECLAEQGVRIDSPADLHSAPPQVLQACFEALHGGGAGP